MNAATLTAKERTSEREKALISEPLTVQEVDRFAQRIAALAAEPGALDHLCRRIDALLAASRKR